MGGAGGVARVREADGEGEGRADDDPPACYGRPSSTARNSTAARPAPKVSDDVHGSARATLARMSMQQVRAGDGINKDVLFFFQWHHGSVAYTEHWCRQQLHLHSTVNFIVDFQR